MKLSILFLPLFIIMCYGCMDTGTPTDNGSSSNLNIMNRTYESNQNFTIELDLHADSGYSWFEEISNPAYVRLDSVIFRPKVPSTDGKVIVGGMTVETFYFHALSPGQCGVKLTEARGWEKDIPPLNIVQLNVVIR